MKKNTRHMIMIAASVTVIIAAVLLSMYFLGGFNKDKKPSTSLTTQETKTFDGMLIGNFNDAAAELDGWFLEGSWDYPATGGQTADGVTLAYDANATGSGTARLDKVTYDPALSWSEIKISKNFDAVDFAAYGSLEIDILVPASAFEGCTGDIRVQAVATKRVNTPAGEDAYKVLASGNCNLKTLTADANGMLCAHLFMPFTLSGEYGGITLGIVGSSTNYSGVIYVDNVGLLASTEVKGTGVNRTVDPINDRAPVDSSGYDTATVINLVDPNATEATKSLYVYLRDTAPDYLLFGHQNDMHHSITEGSDVKNAVNAYPAIIGIDTLSLIGDEGTFDQSVQIAKDAYAAGAILTISTHPGNFSVEGGKYNTIAPVVANILPGGKDHEKFTAYLDLIAEYANACVTPDGTPIPFLFRPWHENNGGWFWWGAANTTIDEYQNLYRFTVEYLRDVKGVHSFLYVYSPNGPFMDQEQYLSRYPGDDYIDVIGFDMYNDSPAEGTENQAWMDSLLSTAQMVVTIAQEKDKIATMSETGIRNPSEGYEGLLDTGNTQKDWFLDVMNTIKNDPVAKNISYMLVWANFNSTMFWTPYYVEGDMKSHEMIDFFVNFYNDDRAVFADRTGNVFGLTGITTAEETPFAYILSPLTNSDQEGTIVLQTRVVDYGQEVTSVIYTVGDQTLSAEKTGDLGYYESTLDTTTLTDGPVDVIVTVKMAAGDELTDASAITLWNTTEKPVKDKRIVDDFESYGGDSALFQSKYSLNCGPNCSLAMTLDSEHVNDGSYSYKFFYTVTSGGWAGSVTALTADWSDCDALQFWITPDGSGQKIVIQIKSAGEEFEVFLPEIAAQTEAQLVTLPFSDFVPKTAGKVFDPTNIQAFGIYINYIDKEVTGGTIYYDSIQAVKQ